MNVPTEIKTANLETQVTWLTKNFQHHTWNSRDAQPFHLAEFFAQTPDGQWVNLSVLNSSQEFVQAVIKAITTK